MTKTAVAADFEQHQTLRCLLWALLKIKIEGEQRVIREMVVMQMRLLDDLYDQIDAALYMERGE